MSLSERVYKCTCGLVLDRDYNSSNQYQKRRITLVRFSMKIQTPGTGGLARSISGHETGLPRSPHFKQPARVVSGG